MYFTELLLIVLVALLVIKPEKLPRVAQKVGFWLKCFRDASAKFKSELHHVGQDLSELDLKEMKDAHDKRK